MVKKIILWILVISCAGTIFMLSHQEAIKSDGLSLSIGEKIVEFMAKINIVDIPVGEYGEKQIELFAEKINGLIRNIAHFSLYFVFGILLLLLILCYHGGKKAAFITLFISLAYAISDEIHQYFIPGRSCQISDVLTDFAGSVTGVIIIMLLTMIKKKTTID